MQQQQRDDRDRQFQVYEILQAQIQSNQTALAEKNGRNNGSGTKPPPCDDFTDQSKVPMDNDFAVVEKFRGSCFTDGIQPSA